MHAFCACIYIQFFENSSPTVFTAIEIRGNAASSVCGNGYVLFYTRETRSHLLRINPFDLPFCTDSGHLALFFYIVPPVPVHTFRYPDTAITVLYQLDQRPDMIIDPSDRVSKEICETTFVLIFHHVDEIVCYFYLHE